MISTENRMEVLEKGFTVIDGAIEVSTAALWRATLNSLVETQRSLQTERTRIDDYMVHNPMLLDSCFYGALEHPVIVHLLDTFLSETSIIYAFTSSSMPAGGANYSHRIHVDCPRVIPKYMTNLGIIIALDDFTEENGATYFLPGSYESTTVPTEEEFFSGAERVFPRRGGLVVFNARTFHSGGMNKSSSDRHALTINACRSFMRQRFDYPRMLSQEESESLSPTLRRLLGFNVRMPVSMDEYYLPEEARLYKANQG